MIKLKNSFFKILSATLLLCLIFTFTACSSQASYSVNDVVLDSASVYLNVGEEQELTYIILPSGAGVSTKWISSDENVVTVNNGTVKGVGEGTALVGLIAGDKSAICTVFVTDPSKQDIPSTGVVLNSQKLVLDVGDTEQLEAKVLPENASDTTIVWSSSQTSVATVDMKGFVTAVGAGTTIITAKTIDGYQKTCFVTVSGEGSSSKQLYIAKIGSLNGRDDFIMGMDASEVLALEEARQSEGLAFMNFDGEPDDVFNILKESGVTDIRIRIWNDPYDENDNSYGGGNCDVDNAVAICKRCEAVGLGVIIDFHYSDFWADPGKQKLPKEWASHKDDSNWISEKIESFTKSSLQSIISTNVTVTMVQIGNETNKFMCESSEWSVICKYMKAGISAVREVCPDTTKVAVHFTNAGGNAYATYAQQLNNNGVEYDVFGTSWYPYYKSHGTLANLTSQLKSIHDTYDKEVMVLETAYAYTQQDLDGCGNTPLETTTQPITVQGMANQVREVIAAIADLGSYGLGVCYWGGVWCAASESTSSAKNRNLCLQYGCGWATHYAHDYDNSANDGGTQVDNNAFFMSDGTPLEALKVFKYVRENGHTTDLSADYLNDQEDYYTVNTGSIKLPDTVSAVLNNGSVQLLPVFWNISDEDLADYIKEVGLYDIEGTTSYGGLCHFYAWVLNVNLLTEGSFEGFDSYGDGTTEFIQSDIGDWQLSYSGGTKKLQLFVSANTGNARMGNNSFHFWDESDVNFEIYQQVDISKLAEFGNGKYGCSFDFQGNDGSDVEIYAYITLNYSDKSPQTFIGDKVEMLGWQKWSRSSVSGVGIDSSVVSITVGFHVSAKSVGNGPWGNIDNAQFYYED